MKKKFSEVNILLIKYDIAFKERAHALKDINSVLTCPITVNTYILLKRCFNISLSSTKGNIKMISLINKHRGMIKHKTPYKFNFII